MPESSADRFHNLLEGSFKQSLGGDIAYLVSKNVQTSIQAVVWAARRGLV